MRRECRERFPHHRLQRKPLVSDPGMHHGTCVTHVPWCMSGSLFSGGRENVPGIPGACATHNFTYLARGPWRWWMMHQQQHLHLWLWQCFYFSFYSYNCTNNAWKQFFIYSTFKMLVTVDDQFIYIYIYIYKHATSICSLLRSSFTTGAMIRL